MTITIASMRDKPTADAVRGGGWMECPLCCELGYVDCPRCLGHGRIRVHYVGRAMPRQGIKGSALGNPYKVGGKGILACPTVAGCLHQYEVMLRMTATRDGTDVERARIAALDAIVADLEAGYAVALACWCASGTVEECRGKCHAPIVADCVLERVKL